MKFSHLFSAVILSASLFLFSCSKSDNPVISGTDDNSNNTATGGGKGNHISTTANPVICGFAQYQVGNDATWRAISVMNADGSNFTKLIPGHVFFSYPTWSNNGTAISYIEGTYLKKFNVSVVNNIPTASTPTTLLSVTTADSCLLACQAWSSVANEIALVKRQTSSSVASVNRYNKLFIISSNGGTPAQIYNAPGTVISSITWSPDGSKIAFFSSDIATQTISLKVISRTDSVLASYSLGTVYPLINFGIDWSRGTSNKLVFAAKPTQTSTSQYIYTFDLDQSNPVPIQTSVPTSEKPQFASWSSNNSQIVYGSQSAGTNPTRLFTFSSNSITAFTTPAALYNSSLNWKR